MNDDHATMPNIQIQNTPTADHDLLIRLDTKFDILAGKFDELSDNIVTRVDALEKEAVRIRAESEDLSEDFATFKKETEVQFRDQGNDISFLKKWFWIATGALGAFEIILAVWFVRHYGASPF